MMRSLCWPWAHCLPGVASPSAHSGPTRTPPAATEIGFAIGRRWGFEESRLASMKEPKDRHLMTTCVGKGCFHLGKRTQLTYFADTFREGTSSRGICVVDETFLRWKGLKTTGNDAHDTWPTSYPHLRGCVALILNDKSGTHTKH